MNFLRDDKVRRTRASVLSTVLYVAIFEGIVATPEDIKEFCEETGVITSTKDNKIEIVWELGKIDVLPISTALEVLELVEVEPS